MTPQVRCMATQWILSTAFAITLLFSSPVYAEGPDGDEFEPGFKGAVQAFVGFGSSKSLSDANDENKKIDSLSESASAETEVMAAPLVDLEYTFSNRATSLFLGRGDVKGIDGNFFLGMGIRQKLMDDSVMTISYIPQLALFDDEVWEAPYFTGVERSETNRDSQAFSIGFEGLFGAPLKLRYTYATQDIEDEKSGASQVASGKISAGQAALLQRDSKAHIVETGVMLPLSQNFMVEAGFLYAQNNADGDAMSFNDYGGRLELMFMQPAYRIFASVSYDSSDYDKTHPVFNTKREDTIVSSSIGVEIPRPFGYENISLMIMGDYTTRDSNITFYDVDEFMVGTGVNWQF